LSKMSFAIHVKRHASGRKPDRIRIAIAGEWAYTGWQTKPIRLGIERKK